MANHGRPDPLLEKVESFQNLLISAATGGAPLAADYKSLRQELTNHQVTKEALPRFVYTCRDLDQFWQFIKYKYSTYQERRDFIWQEFSVLLLALESQPSSVLKLPNNEAIEKLSTDSVQTAWNRALSRLATDPEAAITSARSLLETVCKHILEDLGIAYDDAAEMPKLYRQTSEALNVAPSQHTEPVFKQILGGCTSVIEGLAALRNKLGDAHGGGKARARPAARHALLAVNLAGTMTSFLVATWEQRKSADK